MKQRFKLLSLFIILGSFIYSLQAQQTNYSRNSRDTRWILDATAGANIDLIRSASSPESKLLETRPRVAPSLGFRGTYLFSDKLGAYARFQVNLYESKQSEYDPSGITGDIMREVFDTLLPIGKSIRKIKPSVDAGIVYRFEQNNWSIYPGVGLGYMAYLPDIKSNKSWTKDDNLEHSISYRQHASSIFLNLGVSTRYYVSPRSSLVLDINFQQPLQKSFAELVVKTNDVESDKKRYETATAGRNINISLGYGIAF